MLTLGLIAIAVPFCIVTGLLARHLGLAAAMGRKAISFRRRST